MEREVILSLRRPLRAGLLIDKEQAFCGIDYRLTRGLGAQQSNSLSNPNAPLTPAPSALHFVPWLVFLPGYTGELACVSSLLAVAFYGSVLVEKWIERPK